jgi:hypothetical protein
MSDAPQPADLGVGLDDLIRTVHTLAPEDDPIARLQAAVVVSDQLGQLGDHVVGHFVDQARHAGASWREIGEGMGVTKQAAQKRFVPSVGDIPREGFLSRFTPRAKAVLSEAEGAARTMGSAQIRTEHVLLGLVFDPGGLSRQAIEAQGVTVEQVRAGVDAVAQAPVDDVPASHIPFSPEAKKILELALREALRLHHNYIGTEHLLLGLLRDRRSPAARVLHDLGVSRDEVEAWLRALLAEMAAAKS